MKYHICVKFIAILLATLFLSAAVFSGAGIFLLMDSNLYEQTVDEKYEEQLGILCHSLAVEFAHRYASLELGKIPESYWESYRNPYTVSLFQPGYYFYTITGPQGEVLESTVTGDVSDAYTYETVVTNLGYRQMVSITPISDQYYDFGPTQEILHEESVPTSEAQTIYSDVFYDYSSEQTVEIRYIRTNLGKCNVTVYLLDGALVEDPYWAVLRQLQDYRYDLFWVLALGLLLFSACAVYLCCAAGRRPGTEEVKARGLNALPLDLYLGLCIGGELCLTVIFVELMPHLIRYNAIQAAAMPALLLIAAACLVFVAFCFACAAQFKTGKGFWWRNSLLGRILRPVFRFLRKCFRACGRLMGMLPVIWQFLVILAVMGFVLLITYLLAFGSSFYRINGFFLLVLLAELCTCVALFCYAVYAFGVLKKGAAAMAQGGLGQLVPTNHLIGPFRAFAWELNRLSGAARRAAEQQMKSERMKTELITNVSHDIKTPLTSIINYVDLLEKPHTEAEGREYLAVLSRQSQQLKKLVEDLMDMSKASTGNLAVEVQTLDLGEALQQALGEFSDKLDAAGLIPVVKAPEAPLSVLADGRHTWRVLSNLLGNAVKYAMPGTRLYLELAESENRVRLSMKNISRDALNVSADELTERFVRGDASRNTEGSGLGLNIAKSLMELQRGSLDVSVDGDLFKVTLSFPVGE